MENILKTTASLNGSSLINTPIVTPSLRTFKQRQTSTDYIKLSIVIPLYNEAKIVEALFSRLTVVIETIQKEIGIPKDQIEVLFVNDGSTDTTFFRLKAICEKHRGFLTINLSRNFGHQIASTAGLEHTKGDFIVIMDGDLQDPPEMILPMYRKAQEGFDVVYAKRKSRAKESVFKLWTAKLFYRLLSSITSIDIPLDTGDFRLMSRRVVDEMNAMPERHRFIRGLTSWVGFKQTAVEYERAERFSGTTKYPLKKMVSFAIDGLTSFSSLPLRLASLLGYAFTFLSMLYFFYVLYKRFFTDDTVAGWSSIVIIVLLIGGIQFFLLGMMGEYVGRIYDEVKQRPLYIVENIYQKKAK